MGGFAFVLTLISKTVGLLPVLLMYYTVCFGIIHFLEFLTELIVGKKVWMCRLSWHFMTSIMTCRKLVSRVTFLDFL